LLAEIGTIKEVLVHNGAACMRASCLDCEPELEARTARLVFDRVRNGSRPGEIASGELPWNI
jgi:hypothetical protein